MDIHEIDNRINEINQLLSRYIVKSKINASFNEKEITIGKVTKLRIAAIVDELTAEAIKNTLVNYIFLTVNDWKRELQTFKPHILFVESCWRGNGDTWGRLGINYNGLKKMRPVLEYCKIMGLKTVFWNKEDPIHYYLNNQNKFGKLACMFDYVFTSDANMIEQYKNDFDKEVNYLSFFCISDINKNLPNVIKKNDAVFAGSYYHEKPERCKDFNLLIDAIEAAGLDYDIYDRNFGKNLEHFTFPEKMKNHIVGTLHPSEMQIANTSYKYQINVNTVKNSPTMFARRVYESLASGTPVITNYSRGVDLLFGDIVIMGDTKEEIVNKIKYYESNPNEYNKIKELGINRCHNFHTFEKRLEKICERCGIKVSNGTRSKISILIYADVDLNYIDGSSIWLCSFINKILEDKKISVKLLFKSNCENSKLIDSVQDKDNLQLIFPKDYGISKKLDKKLSVDLLEEISSDEDIVLVRGYEICKEIADRKLFKNKLVPYVIEAIQDENSISEQLTYMNSIREISLFILVQSQKMKKIFADNFDYIDNIFVLPPIVPESNMDISTKRQEKTIAYVGKFSKLWYSEKLIEMFDLIKKKEKNIKLSIAGSTFRNDLDNSRELKKRFESDNRINYIGGVSRAESLNLIRNSDIGFALRDISIDNDNSAEISTKLLEYISYGKPVILRGTKPHKALLGEDYYLYADTIEEASEKCVRILNDEKLYTVTSEKCFVAYKKYISENSFSKFNNYLKTKIHFKQTILFAGHDFKFLIQIIKYLEYSGEYNIIYDQWSGHDIHDEQKSKKLLEKADIIFCEWGLGNAVWYSNNKFEYQKLFVRMHLQEKDLPYIDKFNLNNIDRIITITPYMKKIFNEKCDIPINKMTMIYNCIDTKKLALQKCEDVNYNIGIMGILPKRKRLDLAIDIIEKLYEKNNKYKLFIKGRKPENASWVWNKRSEREYYKKQFERIEKSPAKKNIYFDEFSTDVENWFSKIGFMLSTSDFEGSHQAPMEGAASGAYPVIRNWEGSDTVYPKEAIFNTIDDMVNFILAPTIDIQYFRDYTKQLDIVNIYRKIREVMEHV